MRILLAAVVLAVATHGSAKAAKPPKAFHFAGKWDSNQGALSLSQTGAKLTGSYSHSDGRIYATVKGGVADGWWTQSTSGRRCPRIRLASHYYGRLQFIAQPDGRSFNGEWTYCDDKLGAGGGSWTGTRK